MDAAATWGAACRQSGIVVPEFRSLVRRCLAIAAATLAAGCGGYQSDLDRHAARVAHGATMVETAAGPVQYAEAGEGPPILILHGVGGGYDQGLLIADALFGGGNRVIAPSRYGYLGTPLPDVAGAEAQAEAHVALLDALGIEQVVVVGFSAGAYSALALARDRPERVSALVLLVPADGPTDSTLANFAIRTPELAELLGAVSDHVYWGLMQTSMSLMLSLAGVPPAAVEAAPAEQRRFAETMVEWVLPASARLAGMANDARALRDLAPPVAGEPSVPVLALCARDDTLVGCGPAERLVRAAPDARLEAFASGGHMLLGRHMAARAIIGDFLRGAGWR